MPLPLLNLDDRKFDDLFAEMRALIPHFAPTWTNHNVADPGIMLLELFAWLTEAAIYRINRVPEASKLRFLRLLGAALQPAQPALVKLTVTAKCVKTAWTLPRGTALTPHRQSGLPPLTFETVHDIIFTPGVGDANAEQTAIVTARQMALVEREPVGISNGKPFQRFAVTKPALLLPSDPFPVRPTVYVQDAPWEFVPNLHKPAVNAQRFTIKLSLNKVVFGDDKQGKIPPAGAPITIDYRYAPSGQGTIQGELLGISSGQPYQSFRLQKPFLPLDFQPPSELEPQVFVDGTLWRYRSSWLNMGKAEAAFIAEPWRNAICFGDRTHGEIPPDQAKIEISYAYTVRPALEIPTKTQFLLVKPPPDAEQMPDLTIRAQKMLDFGKNATGLEEAEALALEMIKPRWRMVTATDFEAIVVGSGFNIARSQCLPGHNLDDPDQGTNLPGHVSVSLAPQARSRLQATPETLAELLSFSPDGGRLVARTKSTNSTSSANSTKSAFVQLWDLEKGQLLVNSLGKLQASTHIAFNATSQRLLTVDDDGQLHLWNAVNGEELAGSAQGTKVIMAQFSPDGNQLVTISTTDAHLHDVRHGAHTALLSKGIGVNQVVFGAHNQLLAVAHADQTIQIWDIASGTKNVDLEVAVPATIIRFSDDEQQLATTDAGDARGAVRLWRTASGKQTVHFEHNAPVIDLRFNHGGERLVVRDAKGACLWSTRCLYQLANLLPDRVASTVTLKDFIFSPDGRRLAVNYSDNIVRLWDVQRGTLLDELAYTASVTALAFSPSGQQLALQINQQAADPSAAYRVELWSLRTASQEPTLLHEWLTNDAVLSQSGNCLTFVDGHLLPLWSIGEARPLSALYLDDNDGVLSRFEALPNTPYLYTVSEGANAQGTALRTVQIWNTQHVYAVRNLVNERRLVTCQHHVAGPLYTNIYIKATVVRGQPVKKVESLQEEIAKSALSEFFHPLRGGPERTGWPWGRNVHVSEVYQVLESVVGVDHVETLLIDTSPDFAHPVGGHGGASIAIPPDHLVNYVVRPEAITIMDHGLMQTPVAARTANRSRVMPSLHKG